MIIHECLQGEPEWHKARAGVFTASTFGAILTPSTLRLSASSQDLENQIIAEILTGDPIEDEEGFGGTLWTERGKALEPKAIELYELITGEETQRVGFITNDDKTIGGSPDRLISIDGILEIKCLKPKNHVAMFRNRELDQDHKPQIQGLMMVTGRKWCDVMAYHPKMPPVIIRVERDVLYIAKLEAALKQMVRNVKETVEEIRGTNK